MSFFTILIGFLLFCSFPVAQAGVVVSNPDQAVVSMNKLDDLKVAASSIDADAKALVQPAKSHAPEPSTLALLFSGFLGVIVRVARKSFAAFKRGMDYVIALSVLIFAAPLMAFVALLVKVTSAGPVIYSQTRVGKGGKTFRIYKFRTMRVDAEKGTGAVWAQKNDPRLTPIGGFLRKCHLDELPQVFNVLKGDMSIVGPRPERPEIVKDLKLVISDYDKRLQIKPGITGLAQVMNRYDETISDVRKKVKYDILYIKKMCWLVEMRVLALTCVVMLTGKGAR